MLAGFETELQVLACLYTLKALTRLGHYRVASTTGNKKSFLCLVMSANQAFSFLEGKAPCHSL